MNLPNIVLAHGCFDVLHVGHVRHLQQAKSMGVTLIVTVTPDKFVAKGEGRPIFSESVRAEVLNALACVNYVSVNLWATAEETILSLRPSIYVKGPECLHKKTPALLEEEKAILLVGGEMRFTDGEVFSSTKITKLTQ